MSQAIVQPEGNYYDKYGTRNPIARYLMSGFLSSFEQLAKRSGAREAFEAGCGEGHLSVALARAGLTVRGCDIAQSCVDKAQQNAALAKVALAVRQASIYDLSTADAAELVVCCEVLEHLEEPERAVDVLASLTKPWLITSVPREPIWRVMNMARGKYWGDLGNTPGHLQHWSSRSFMALIAKRFEIVEVRQPLPWTMLLARVR